MAGRAQLGALRLLQEATPAAPPAGAVLLYSKSDGYVYKQTSAGVESRIQDETYGGVIRVRAVAVNQITLSGTQTIDGVAVVAGDWVLATGQATGWQNNGVYVVAAGAWSRAPLADTAARVSANRLVTVEAGTTYVGSLWRTTFARTDTLGTTSMFWNNDREYLGIQVGNLSNAIADINGVTLADTNWVNFTVGAGTGVFAGTGTVQYAQYRIIGQLVQVRMMRDVTTAFTFGQYNYTNANITASGAVPAAARPSQTTNGAGRMDDSPINVVIGTSGTISYTGGVPKSVAVGDNCDVTFMYFLG